MITQTIIRVLKEDSQLQELLDVSNSKDAPIFTTYNFDNNVKQIVVDYSLGETYPTKPDNYSGVITITICISFKVSEPIKVMNEITTRVLEVLDLKGSQLSDRFSDVYRLKKESSSFYVDNDSGMYLTDIDFSFVTDTK